MDWLETFATSKSYANYLIGAEIGLLTTLMVVLLPRWRVKIEALKDMSTLRVALWIPVEVIIWSPMVILLAVQLDNTPILSLLIGAAHEQIWSALQKTFDSISLVIVKLTVGRFVPQGQEKLPEAAPPAAEEGNS